MEIKINLENIKHLNIDSGNDTLFFEDKKILLLFAPNGTGKTTLYKAFNNDNKYHYIDYENCVDLVKKYKKKLIIKASNLSYEGLINKKKALEEINLDIKKN